MAIRIRQVNGTYVALCAVESDPEEGDIYLDDSIHYALATKFADDWDAYPVDPTLKALMDSQKVRDAQIEAAKWEEAAKLFRLNNPEVAEFGWIELKPYWERLFGKHHSDRISSELETRFPKGVSMPEVTVPTNPAEVSLGPDTGVSKVPALPLTPTAVTTQTIIPMSETDTSQS